MYYDFAIEVAANTLATNPTTQVMKLTKGIVHRIEIQFPAGCAGLAHAQIFSGGHQVLPTNPGGDFSSDDHTIIIDDSFDMSEEPFQWQAVCWNLDDTYSHTIYVRVGVLRGEMALLMSKVVNAAVKFFKMIGINV